LFEHRLQLTVMPQHAITQILRDGALLRRQLRMETPETLQRLREIAPAQDLADGLGCELLTFIQQRLPASDGHGHQSRNPFLGLRMGAEKAFDAFGG
jgi:hypothetical protein